MSDDPPNTFVFAHEIEDKAISILWHEPERLGDFLREFDPEIHLTQPTLRHILEAVTLVYREAGLPDFGLVVQALRELSHFDEAGGLEGLNRIYALEQFHPDKKTTDAIFGEYVRLLKAYALHRKADPPSMPYRFIRGEILLKENKNKLGPGPDFLGAGKIAGKLFKATARKSVDGILISLFPK